MALPVLAKRWFTLKTFTGKDIRFTPFTIGQQKLLLIVKETANKDMDTYKSVIKMTQECVENINLDDLHPSEFEEIFYNIRAIADGKLLKFNVVCQKPTGLKIKEKNDKGQEIEKDDICGTENEVSMDVLNDFEVINIKNFKKKINIKDEEMTIEFRQPRLRDLVKVENKQYPSDEAKAFDILSYCLVKLAVKDQVYDEFTYEDANKFINSLPDIYLKDMMEFFQNQPAYVLKAPKVVKCEKCGNETTFTNGDLKGFL